tara:strand:+ start:3686 stop:3970 length:285 start_codon:yes stop_codon:yes gene_type:complete
MCHPFGFTEPDMRTPLTPEASLPSADPQLLHCRKKALTIFPRGRNTSEIRDICDESDEMPYSCRETKKFRNMYQFGTVYWGLDGHSFKNRTVCG